MHILRFCIHRPGDTAERLLAALAERGAARVVAHDPTVRGLLARETDRCQLLADFEHHLDDIANELRIERWRETVAID
jgi:hypothetical protein